MAENPEPDPLIPATVPSNAEVSTSSPSSSETTPLPETPPNLHQNTMDPAASWIVQKYGGTSVGKFAARISEEIVPRYLDQNRVAIVCSARSGTTKALGTTNLLLRAASEALNDQKSGLSSSLRSGLATPLTSWSGNFVDQTTPMTPPRQRSLSRVSSSSRSGSPPPHFGLTPANGRSSSTNSESGYLGTPAFVTTVGLIQSEHFKAADENIRDPELLKNLKEDIENDCVGLINFLYALQVVDELSPRSKDSIVGMGERLACQLVGAILCDRGVDCEVVSLENIVPPAEDGDELSDSPGALGQQFYDRLAAVIGERVRQCEQRVPIITGFFGPVPGSLLRQIGRGYTDLTAALTAVGLQAEELQIWKEVDGIFTADPRKVPFARLIPIISPEEASELTYYGSEVIHPFTMEQVIRKKIPIRIKNVENPLGGGTVIHPNPDETEQMVLPPTPPSASQMYAGQGEGGILSVPINRRLPTAVTIKENIVVLSVNSNRKTMSHGFLARIFSTLDRFGVVVDLVSTSEVHVSMAIENMLEKRVLNKLVRELEKLGTVTIHPNMAILSLVGKQMRKLVGIAGRMFTALAEGSINLEMISQGASEINISCVIDGRDSIKALNLIHQNCLQIKPEGARGIVGQWLF